MYEEEQYLCHNQMQTYHIQHNKEYNVWENKILLLIGGRRNKCLYIFALCKQTKNTFDRNLEVEWCSMRE